MRPSSTSGRAPSRAGDFEKAVLHFDRLWSSFPSSSSRPAALWNAALARERLGQFAAALERFEKYLELKTSRTRSSTRRLPNTGWDGFRRRRNGCTSLRRGPGCRC